MIKRNIVHFNSDYQVSSIIRVWFGLMDSMFDLCDNHNSIPSWVMKCYRVLFVIASLYMSPNVLNIVLYCHQPVSCAVVTYVMLPY